MPPRRRASPGQWALLALLLAGVLGQGERLDVDPRYSSPTRTLVTYWLALRAGDAPAAWACLAHGPYDAPYPGMLWFLPPTERFHLLGVRELPVQRGRMVVSYEVRYRPVGLDRDFGFRTMHELVCDHGEWRIAQPPGLTAMPEWRPTERPLGS